MFENDMWLLVVAGGPIILAVPQISDILGRRRRGRDEQRTSDRLTEKMNSR